MPGRSRSLRRIIRVGIPLIGVAAILAGAFLVKHESIRAALGLTGAILMLISSFALHDRILPNERQLVALRAEVDSFIAAVRRTNSTALATAQSRGELATFHAACDDLVQRAQHIGTVAAAIHGLPAPRIAMPVRDV